MLLTPLDNFLDFLVTLTDIKEEDQFDNIKKFEKEAITKKVFLDKSLKFDFDFEPNLNFDFDYNFDFGFDFNTNSKFDVKSIIDFEADITDSNN